MPVDFLHDEDPQTPPIRAAHASDHGDLRGALPAAVRSAIPWLVVGAVVLPLGMLLMKRPLVAASQLLLHGGGAYWESCWMPPILFGFFGLAYGGVIGWRISSSAGLTGTPAWLIGVLAVAALTFVGGLTAAMLFNAAIPVVCWISLGFLAGGGLLGACIFAFWMD